MKTGKILINFCSANKKVERVFFEIYPQTTDYGNITRLSQFYFVSNS